MTFPLSIAGRTVTDPPGLAALVRADAAAGGAILAGQRPRDWVPALVRQGLLPAQLAVGLVAALLQDPSPSTLVECTHLARALGDRRLGTVLAAAVDAHDVGVLLVPGEEGRSVEDLLLLAAAELAEVDDAEFRGNLLDRLRHAGLASAELQVLARGGNAEEVRTWLPAILAEALPDAAALASLLFRQDTRPATVAILQELAEGARREMWQAMREADPRIATDVRLRTALFPLLSRTASR
ncbi:MAG: hypothetical protein EP330_31015 [Deltaproteobacteria bacterium]|nr:MAG: hypothetical protein EP330_31015 [Deltaproteobacteria bacterium]